MILKDKKIFIATPIYEEGVDEMLSWKQPLMGWGAAIVYCPAYDTGKFYSLSAENRMRQIVSDLSTGPAHTYKDKNYFDILVSSRHIGYWDELAIQAQTTTAELLGMETYGISEIAREYDFKKYTIA